ncbi:hypothetical protein EAO70_27440 [Streptomyces sp. adm13(2018)]|nr:hypothetical protein EAO70_27440 [Streptomyces sp. adm13(2018)]
MTWSYHRRHKGRQQTMRTPAAGGVPGGSPVHRRMWGPFPPGWIPPIMLRTIPGPVRAGPPPAGDRASAPASVDLSATVGSAWEHANTIAEPGG